MTNIPTFGTLELGVSYGRYVRSDERKAQDIECVALIEDELMFALSHNCVIIQIRLSTEYYHALLMHGLGDDFIFTPAVEPYIREYNGIPVEQAPVDGGDLWLVKIC